ncbi:MAG: HrpA-like RNA helicase [Hyperionvirus sp.]|uniref:RNA helicase n=1 Tax=Hyperionvirus sp. TaxID=2487770 RepID=A0A3G5A8Y3_9VIRU|nr:MAG: HrpA-like RNA helicase [Hyperionvirus sp.]
MDVGILDPGGINPNPLTGALYSDGYKKLGAVWSKFAAYQNARDIIEDIKSHQVILVISGTGSGKTVLFPKYVLHAYNYDAKVAITLPKQIIAKSAAEFAAKTLDVKLGDEVGYQYKGGLKLSKKTKLLYATDGTIVGRLLTDPALSDFDVVIIDEAHERKIQIDFLLYLLRNTLKIRPTFKLIIMSATIDASLFESYFYEFTFKTFSIGTKTNYPIESIYTEKSVTEKEYMQLGFEIIEKIVSPGSGPGDILFFVTSVIETQSGCEMIIELTDLFCVSVFAGMDPILQELAQDKDKYKILADNKGRKLVIATNVAESSLTIDGIKYVIDCGFEIFSYYEPEMRAHVIVKQLISQAQAIQRKGRAGRTQPGVCYHLYTKDDFLHRMAPFPEPSIRTSNIDDVCLRLLHLDIGRNIKNLLGILSNFIEPPREKYVKAAVYELVRLGLLREDEITPLGDLVSELQMDPAQGVGIVLAARLKCSKEVSAIFSVIDACKHNIGELFHRPKETDSAEYVAKYNRARKELLHRYGDHLTILKIFTVYRKYRKFSDKKKLNDWCYKHFLKKSVLEKALKYYHRAKERVYQVMSNTTYNELEYQNLKLEYKIILSICYGFRLNVTSLKSTKAGVNKDSFMKFLDIGASDRIVYDELLLAGGRLDMNIVSKVPPSVMKIFTEII